MTRKGARMICDGSVYTVIHPGDRVRAKPSATPSWSVSATTVDLATSNGWLAPDPATGELRLTEAGALALRSGAASPDRTADRQTVTAVGREPSRNAAAARITMRDITGPIARLRSRRDNTGQPYLSSTQAEAAARLAADFERGQMTPRVTANWDRAALGHAAEPQRTPPSSHLADGTAAAQDRVRRAMADAGYEFADLLLEVCCMDVGIEAIERRRHWPARSGRIVLCLALDRLARHYGIIASGPARGQSRHWGASDYRPSLTAHRASGTA